MNRWRRRRRIYTYRGKIIKSIRDQLCRLDDLQNDGPKMQINSIREVNTVKLIEYLELLLERCI